jgi:propanol-preferring alcohol dehydrogenase
MKAMVLQAVGPIESSPLVMTDLPDPRPGHGEVRVRVSCCAVCRTDLHIIEGDLGTPPKLPLIPGHQVVGLIDMVGEGCRRLAPGSRVGIAWLRSTDGTCRFCRRDRENLCEAARFTGFHSDGGYAQYAIVPEDFAYDIPPDYDDASATPLLCAGIIGYRALKRCNIGRGGRLAIFGFGSSAHIISQICIGRGCSVFVVSRGPLHQRLARELGAAWVGSDASAMPAKMDGAIVFAPSGPLVLDALNCLDSGGVVALAGIHMSPIPQIDYDRYLFRERDIHPVTANTRQDGRELLSEAALLGIRPRIVKYQLEDANRALNDLKHDRIEGTAVLLI